MYLAKTVGSASHLYSVRRRGIGMHAQRGTVCKGHALLLNSFWFYLQRFQFLDKPISQLFAFLLVQQVCHCNGTAICPLLVSQGVEETGRWISPVPQIQYLQFCIHKRKVMVKYANDDPMQINVVDNSSIGSPRPCILPR